MTIQLALLIAVHGALGRFADTATLPVPPAAAKLAEVALSEKTACTADVMVTTSRVVCDTPPPLAPMVRL